MNLLGSSISETSDLNSDYQLIIAAYQKYGAKCVQHFIGAFAFVIWDEKKQKCVCPAGLTFNIKTGYCRDDTDYDALYNIVQFTKTDYALTFINH